jgi:putative transposase
VSTREVEAVMHEFGIESLSSSQVSRAARMLDEELDAWRNRPLGQFKYLFLDARYEKMRHGGIVRDGEEDQKMIRGGLLKKPRAPDSLPL